MSIPFAGYDPEDGPAARSPAGQWRTRSSSASPTAKASGFPSAPRSSQQRRSSRQCPSRNAMPVSSSRVSREARLTTRSTLTARQQPAQDGRRERGPRSTGYPDNPRPPLLMSH